MSGSENESDSAARQRKRDVFSDFLQKNITKGEMAIKHAVGLGQTPNMVPLAEPSLDGPAREVEVGWHPVGGLAGKWFAESTSLGKLITERIHKYPDPTQHWAVLVGDYAHQLWMDENFHVIYTNAKINREEWKTFKVGMTRFNDDATRRAGESVIQSIREQRPVYNLITNNCQTYALKLLDAIHIGKHKQFGTTLAVYQRLSTPSKVKELFINPNEMPDAKTEDVAAAAPTPGASEEEDETGSHNTVALAAQVMNEQTNQLDTHEEMKKYSS